MPSKLRAATVSIVVNVTLLASKILAAFLTGSVAILAECAHSLFDLVASVLAYFGVKKASEPSDETHSFGHDKFETLSSLLQSLLILATALIVLHEGYAKIIHPVAVENEIFGIALMVISIPVTLFTSRYLTRVAHKAGGSQALEADAAHFTTDVIGSVAVLLGLIAVKLGFLRGDGIAACLVALVMIYISYELIHDAYKVLLDYEPHPMHMDAIRRILRTYKSMGYHKLRARRAGSKIFMEVHLQMDGDLSVEQGHALAMRVKRRLLKEVPQLREVTIHIEPHPRPGKRRIPPPVKI